MPLPAFPSTAFFELFSAIRRRPKNLKKEPTDLPRAHFGAREKDRLVGGRRRYTPTPPATQELFGGKSGNYAFSTEPDRATGELWRSASDRQGSPTFVAAAALGNAVFRASTGWRAQHPAPALGAGPDACRLPTLEVRQEGRES